MAEEFENAPREEPPAAPAMAEPDAPQSARIFFIAIIGVAVLGAMIAMVDQVFNLSLREEVAQKLLRPENGQLRQLRAEEQAKLSRYQWVDEKAGQVRIPLERAMELTLAEWKERPEGFAPGAPDLAAPSPAPAAPKPRPGESAPGAAASKGAQRPPAPGSSP